MRIEEDVKLDYKDVLFRPKRSKLESRRDVNLTRTFKFHYGNEWTGVPIMSSNMDGVGTFEMAKVLQDHKMLTVMRKHYSVDDWKQQSEGVKMKYLSVCTGTGIIWDPDAPDYATMKAVLAMYPDIKFRTIMTKHRYIYILAKNKKERKELLKNLKYEILPYPKEKDE